MCYADNCFVLFAVFGSHYGTNFCCPWSIVFALPSGSLLNLDSQSFDQRFRSALKCGLQLRWKDVSRDDHEKAGFRVLIELVVGAPIDFLEAHWLSSRHGSRPACPPETCWPAGILDQLPRGASAAVPGWRAAC